MPSQDPVQIGHFNWWEPSISGVPILLGAVYAKWNFESVVMPGLVLLLDCLV